MSLAKILLPRHCRGGTCARPFRYNGCHDINGYSARAPTGGAPTRIFIRSGEPQDHGNFVVNTWKQDPPQRHKDHKDGLLDGGGDGRGQIAFEFGNHFTFGPGLQKLSSGIVSPCPDLGKKILVAVAVEYELGFL